MCHPQSPEVIEMIKAKMEKDLWGFIDAAGENPDIRPDPRIWGHLLVYAPEEIKDKLRYLWEDTPTENNQPKEGNQS